MAALKEDPFEYILEATEDKKADTLLPELIAFIEKESKSTGYKKAEDFFFIEGGRKGHIKCKYVASGTRIYGLSVREEGAVLNITHVAIRNDGGGEKNVLDRICREVLAQTPIKGVRIESIMSEKWKRKFKEDWKDNGEDNKVLLKEELKDQAEDKGGRSKRKSKRRKSRKRK